MKHRLFTILSALSLLLFVAAVVLWVRSYRRNDFAAYRWIERRADGGFLYTQWNVGSRVGVIYIGDNGHTRTKRDPKDSEGFRVQSFPFTKSSAFDSGFNQRYVRWRLGRLVWVDELLVQGNWSHTRYLTVPVWAFVALFAVLPACFVYRVVRYRCAARVGYCNQCGYDLRATPNRCPECGNAPTAPLTMPRGDNEQKVKL